MDLLHVQGGMAFVESAACACEVNERLRRIGGHLKMLEGSLPRVGTEAHCTCTARAQIHQLLAARR